MSSLEAEGLWKRWACGIEIPAAAHLNELSDSSRANSLLISVLRGCTATVPSQSLAELAARLRESGDPVWSERAIFLRLRNESFDPVLFRSLADRQVSIGAFFDAALTLRTMGENSEGRSGFRCLVEALKYAGLSESPEMNFSVRFTLIEAQSRQGDLDGAHSDLVQVLTHNKAEEHGVQGFRALVLCVLFDLSQGDNERAISDCAMLRAISGPGEDPLVSALSRITALRADDGERQGEEREGRRGVSPSKSGGYGGTDLCDALNNWSESIEQQKAGHLRPAIQRIQAAIEYFSESEFPQVLAELYAYRAALHASVGEFQKAFKEMVDLRKFESALVEQGLKTKAMLTGIHGEFEDHSRLQAELDAATEKILAFEQIFQNKEALLETRNAEIRKLNERLNSFVLRDPVTGLFSRFFVEEAVSGLMRLSRRKKQRLCVAVVGLASVPGDEREKTAAVASLGETLRSSLRESDVVSRLGGEEFCVVFPDMDATQAQARLEELGSRRPSGEQESRGSGFSAGLSVFPEDATAFAQLLTLAERALRDARSKGKTTYAYSELISHGA